MGAKGKARKSNHNNVVRQMPGDVVTCWWCDVEFERTTVNVGKRNFCTVCRELGVPRALTRFESRIRGRIKRTGSAILQTHAPPGRDPELQERSGNHGRKPAQVRQELRDILHKANAEARRRVNDEEYMKELNIVDLSRFIDVLSRYGVGTKTEITGVDDGPLQYGVFVLPPLQAPQGLALLRGEGEEVIPEADFDLVDDGDDGDDGGAAA